MFLLQARLGQVLQLWLPHQHLKVMKSHLETVNSIDTSVTFTDTPNRDLPDTSSQPPTQSHPAPSQGNQINVETMSSTGVYVTITDTSPAVLPQPISPATSSPPSTPSHPPPSLTTATSQGNQINVETMSSTGIYVTITDTSPAALPQPISPATSSPPPTPSHPPPSLTTATSQGNQINVETMSSTGVYDTITDTPNRSPAVLPQPISPATSSPPPTPSLFQTKSMLNQIAIITNPMLTWFVFYSQRNIQTNAKEIW